MQIEFDPAKNVSNLAKHGVALSLAQALEWDWLISREDDTRHDYFELRMVGFAPIGQTVYCVVFVELEADVLRIISLRPATKPEV